MAFVPMTPTHPFISDSDGDGLSDDTELKTGTNPMDRGSALRFVGMTRAGGNVVVKWLGREGYAYELLGAGTLSELATSPINVTNTVATSGRGAWLEATCVHTNHVSVRLGYFSVKLRR